MRLKLRIGSSKSEAELPNLFKASQTFRTDGGSLFPEVICLAFCLQWCRAACSRSPNTLAVLLLHEGKAKMAPSAKTLAVGLGVTWSTSTKVLPWFFSTNSKSSLIKLSASSL